MSAATHRHRRRRHRRLWTAALTTVIGVAVTAGLATELVIRDRGTAWVAVLAVAPLAVAALARPLGTALVGVVALAAAVVVGVLDGTVGRPGHLIGLGGVAVGAVLASSLAQWRQRRARGEPAGVNSRAREPVEAAASR